jgi:hypothetical protein
LPSILEDKQKQRFLGQMKTTVSTQRSSVMDGNQGTNDGEVSCDGYISMMQRCSGCCARPRPEHNCDDTPTMEQAKICQCYVHT